MPGDMTNWKGQIERQLLRFRDLLAALQQRQVDDAIARLLLEPLSDHVARCRSCPKSRPERRGVVERKGEAEGRKKMGNWRRFVLPRSGAPVSF